MSDRYKDSPLDHIEKLISMRAARLGRLVDLKAPAIVLDAEHRMLEEAFREWRARHVAIGLLEGSA